MFNGRTLQRTNKSNSCTSGTIEGYKRAYFEDMMYGYNVYLVIPQAVCRDSGRLDKGERREVDMENN